MIVVNNVFGMFLDSVCKILLSIFPSMIIREMGLKHYSFVGSFCGLFITVIVASEIALYSVPSGFILWNSMKSTNTFPIS